MAGDGTTSVVVICGALLSKCIDLLARGVHPTIISDAFGLAARRAVEVGPTPLGSACTQRACITGVSAGGVSQPGRLVCGGRGPRPASRRSTSSAQPDALHDRAATAQILETIATPVAMEDRTELLKAATTCALSVHACPARAPTAAAPAAAGTACPPSPSICTPSPGDSRLTRGPARACARRAALRTRCAGSGASPAA